MTNYLELAYSIVFFFLLRKSRVNTRIPTAHQYRPPTPLSHGVDTHRWHIISHSSPPPHPTPPRPPPPHQRRHARCSRLNMHRERPFSQRQAQVLEDLDRRLDRSLSNAFNAPSSHPQPSRHAPLPKASRHQDHLFPTVRDQCHHDHLSHLFRKASWHRVL